MLLKSRLRSPTGVVGYGRCWEWTVEDKLQFWVLKEWLTIYQAAMLACGEDPSLDEGGDPIAATPVGYDAFHQALLDDVKKDNLEQMVGDVPDAIFKEIKNDYRSRPIIKLNTELKVTDIKQWLTRKGIKPPFFFPEDEGDITTTSRPIYQTHLMSLMYKTIDRYYGENYDPNDRDTVPKQVNVTDWLETN